MKGGVESVGTECQPAVDGVGKLYSSDFTSSNLEGRVARNIVCDSKYSKKLSSKFKNGKPTDIYVACDWLAS